MTRDAPALAKEDQTPRVSPTHSWQRGRRGQTCRSAHLHEQRRIELRDRASEERVAAASIQCAGPGPPGWPHEPHGPTATRAASAVESDVAKTDSFFSRSVEWQLGQSETVPNGRAFRIRARTCEAHIGKSGVPEGLLHGKLGNNADRLQVGRTLPDEGNHWPPDQVSTTTYLRPPDVFGSSSSARDSSYGALHLGSPSQHLEFRTKDDAPSPRTKDFGSCVSG